MTTILTRQRNLDWHGWLNRYPDSKGTKDTYYSGVKKFLCSAFTVNTSRGKPTPEELAKLANNYIAQATAGSRDVMRDLENFVQNWHGATLTLETYIAGIREFLRFTCDIIIGKQTLQEIKPLMPKGMGQAQTKNEQMTRESWRTILMNSNTRMKAFLLFGISSGIRPGEILKLQLDDVKLDSTPTVFVRPEYTKEGKGYTAFLNAESVQALRDWYAVRPNYINREMFKQDALTRDKRYQALVRAQKGKTTRTSPVTPPTSANVFPFTYESAVKTFITTLKKTGLYKRDSKTNRTTVHLHLMRHYFISIMQQYVGRDMALALSGHTPYLGTYDDQIQTGDYYQKYLEGASHLFILQDPKLSEYEQALTKQNQDLLDRVGKLEAFIAQLPDMQQRLDRAEFDAQVNEDMAADLATLNAPVKSPAKRTRASHQD